MFTDSMHRRRLQAALGLLWLLDGLLQLQPAMWSKSFASNVITPGASGQPAVIGTPIVWVAHLVGAHPLPCNLGIAAVQLLLGVALLARRPFALHASFLWALAVRWLGEGFGMIPTGAASPLTGAPGAAVLYALDQRPGSMGRDVVRLGRPVAAAGLVRRAGSDLRGLCPTSPLFSARRPERWRNGPRVTDSPSRS